MEIQLSDQKQPTNLSTNNVNPTGFLGHRTVEHIPSNGRSVGCGPNMLDEPLKALATIFLASSAAIVFFATAYFTGSAVVGATVTAFCALAYFSQHIGNCNSSAY